MKTTVFGSGSWGTSISLLLRDNGYDVTLWSKFEEEGNSLRKTRQNPLLKGVEIPEDIYITSNLSDAVDGAGTAIIAVPSYGLRETAETLAGKVDANCIIICMSKGIEKETSSLFTSILKASFGEAAQIASVSGPTHAEEVARRIPTACVAASEDISVAMRVQNLLMNEYLRVYTSTDVIGVELGAALKNIIALGAGISIGLGFGDNTMAMLITRGLAEIAELCVRMGGRKETLAGLAGLGDLIVTCTSGYSRNRQAGILIGKGMPAQDAMREVGAVVEGYYAAKAAKELAEKMDIDMPISLETYRVLYENKLPMKALKDLMGRSRRSEQSTGEEIWVT